MNKMEEQTQDEMFMKKWIQTGEDEKKKLQQEEQDRAVKLKYNQ